MRKHAYLIMAHQNFDFLKELLLALDDARNDIYLHIDQKADTFDASAFSNLLLHAQLFFTPRVSVHWGGYSQVLCELTLLKAAAHGHYAYYHLLSGADFPLKSQTEIHQFFADHAGYEFLHCDTSVSQVPKYIRERISLYHFFRESSFPLAEPADMLLTRLQRLLHVDRLKNSGIQVQKGANWFSITDAFVQYVLSQETFIQKYFRHSVCADELFLQTLAENSAFANRIYKSADPSLGNLRYVDWQRGNGNSPYTFQEADREFLLSLPHLFARKFDHNIFTETP